MNTESTNGLAAPQGANGIDWNGRLLEMVAAMPWQERSKEDCRINVRWFLSFCRQRELGVKAPSAEAFFAWLRGDRGAPAWQVGRVERSVRWFLDRIEGGPAVSDAGRGQAQAGAEVHAPANRAPQPVRA